MSTRATATLPYKPSIVVQLNRNGYRTTKDILNSTPIQISEDLKFWSKFFSLFYDRNFTIFLPPTFLFHGNGFC